MHFDEPCATAFPDRRVRRGRADARASWELGARPARTIAFMFLPVMSLLALRRPTAASEAAVLAVYEQAAARVLVEGSGPRLPCPLGRKVGETLVKRDDGSVEGHQNERELYPEDHPPCQSGS